MNSMCKCRDTSICEAVRDSCLKQTHLYSSAVIRRIDSITVSLAQWFTVFFQKHVMPRFKWASKTVNLMFDIQHKYGYVTSYKSSCKSNHFKSTSEGSWEGLLEKCSSDIISFLSTNCKYETIRGGVILSCTFIVEMCWLDNEPFIH